MEIETQQTLIANPAATYCAQIGGTYDLIAGTCTLNGVAYDAWNLYYAAQSQVSASSININDIISPMVSLMVVMMMMGMMKNMMMPGSKKGAIRSSYEGLKAGGRYAYEGVKAGASGVKEAAKSIW